MRRHLQSRNYFCLLLLFAIGKMNAAVVHVVQCLCYCCSIRITWLWIYILWSYSRFPIYEWPVNNDNNTNFNFWVIQFDGIPLLLIQNKILPLFFTFPFNNTVNVLYASWSHLCICNLPEHFATLESQNACISDLYAVQKHRPADFEAPIL